MEIAALSMAEVKSRLTGRLAGAEASNQGVGGQSWSLLRGERE